MRVCFATTFETPPRSIHGIYKTGRNPLPSPSLDMGKTKSLNKEADSVQSLILIHKTKASIKKNESQRKVHKAVAEGLEKSLMTKGKLNIERVNLSLLTVSEALLAGEQELETSEEKAQAWEKIMWEGRYCDYIAKALASVKSSASWQASSFKNKNWASIRLILHMGDSHSSGLTDTISCASKELGFPARAIKLWINIYAERCASKAHHGGLENLIVNGAGQAVLDQILDDKKSIYDITPVCYHSAIPCVIFAIENYQNSLFSKSKKDWELTAHGKKLGLSK